MLKKHGINRCQVLLLDSFLYMVRNKTDTNSELFKEGYDVAMYKIPVESDSAIESALP